MIARYCLAFLSLLLANDVFAASAEVWLDRMAQSFRELNYRGAFSYMQGNSMQSFRIGHAVIEGKEFERLEFLDGEQRDVIRRDHYLDCIHSGHQLVRFYLPVPASGAKPQQAAAVSRNYTLSLDGSGRVAGREVVGIAVTPKDTFRYGYRLSLDEASGLLLRSELIGEGGQVLERFQFVDIELGMAIPKDYFNGATEDTTASVQAEQSGASIIDRGKELPMAAQGNSGSAGEGQHWQVGWVPAGFEQTDAGSRAGVADVGADMKIYTDGLAVFSVFIEPTTKTDVFKSMEGSAHKGATTAYFKVLILEGRPHRVTVVGEVPRQTAELVAQSVALVVSQ